MNSPDVVNPMPPIPSFLLVTPADVERRRLHWERNPPRSMMFDLEKVKREESPETRAFREQMEAQAAAKKAAMFDKMKRKKDLKKVDRSGQRWNPRRNRWEDDPQLMAAVENERKARLAAAGVRMDLPTKVKADTPPKPKSDKPKVARAPKGAPIVRECSDKVTALPEKGKRREVALACFGKPAKMADVAKRLECSEGSVRSHLTDLHQKHGFGYVIENGAAELKAPKGWKP